MFEILNAAILSLSVSLNIYAAFESQKLKNSNKKANKEADIKVKHVTKTCYLLQEDNDELRRLIKGKENLINRLNSDIKKQDEAIINLYGKSETSKAINKAYEFNEYKLKQIKNILNKEAE